MTARKAAAERFADTLCQLQGSRGVARRLLTLTADADYKLSDVVACLETDPALATKILSVVNSSRYGLRHKVASVRQAAALLGQKSLRLLAVSFSLNDGLTKGTPASLLDSYARRAVLVASAASRLARLARLTSSVAPDEAYTAGLLADVGVLIFAQYQPKIYLPAYESCLHGGELVAAERDLFDLAHPELGARFLGRWGLPAAVVAAVAEHHATDSVHAAAGVHAIDSVDAADDVHAAGGAASGVGLPAVLRGADLLATAVLDPSESHVQSAVWLLRQTFDIERPRSLVAGMLADLGDAVGLFGVTPAPAELPAQTLAAFEPLALGA